MNDFIRLRDIVIEFLAKGAKAYELEGICEKYGIECDKTLDPMSSKRVYLKSGFTKKSLEQLKDIVRQITFEGCDTSFVHDVEPFLNDDFFVIPMVTRRILLNWLCSQRNLEGAINITSLLALVWNIDILQITGWDNRSHNVREYIAQHMVRNEDISYKELFEDIFDFMYIPDRQLFRFIETVVNPPVRDAEDQIYYIKEINHIIRECGHRLYLRKSIAGNPIYTIEKAADGVGGRICNIIFAAVGGKPDIVIEDALTNRLNVIQDKEDCLFYTSPITSNAFLGTN